MNLNNIIKYKIITYDINLSLESISKIMKQADIGFIPITKNNIIIEVITDRDIVVRGLAKKTKNINNIISTNIICIDINSSINEALNYFSEHKIKRLLITENKKYIGVLSINDILKIYNKKIIIDTLKIIYSKDNINKNTEIDEFIL